MQDISRQEFEQRIVGAKMLTSDTRGPGVFLTPENKIIKIFWQKGIFTSNRLIPYALRFERNTVELMKRGIQTVSVEEVTRCRELNMYLVVYPCIPGTPIRELNTPSAIQSLAMTELPDFLSTLHQKGIYYKALHLGNILIQPHNSFALIDVHATKFYNKPLSVNKRLRNFVNIFRYPEDYALLKQSGLSAFLERYLDKSLLSPNLQKKLITSLSNLHLFPALRTATRELNLKYHVKTNRP